MVALSGGSASAGGNIVWWEGEAPVRTNFPAPTAHEFRPNGPDESRVLSGGAWLGIGAERKDVAYAEYRVMVPRTGTWRLYARKFWKHGPFRWRFDEGAWQTLPADAVLIDDAPIRQFLGANWVYAGNLPLTKGTHTFRVDLDPGTGPTALDCFVLTDRLFHPRGALKPGERWPKTPDWVPYDPTTPTPHLNLRAMNHRVAGIRGWLRRDRDQLRFTQDREPTRFWGVTVTADFWRMERERIDWLAHRLAQSGVNLVRFHLDFNQDQPGKELDRIQYAVAALKREGIYSYLGFYCLAVANDTWFGLGPDVVKPGGKPFSLLFFHPEVQARYRHWARVLFTTPNPYADGKPLAKDPAVAMVELVDEDNYFFWTFTASNFTEPSLAMLEARFGRYLAGRYGSVSAALAAWGPERTPSRPDLPLEGRVALYDAGQLGGADWARSARNEARARDQARFLAEDLREFWADTTRWFKQDLGFGGVVVTTNWTTADPRVLTPLDKWTNQAGDALAMNGYFGGEVRGTNPGFGLPVGNYYRDISALKQPEQAVLMQVQYADTTGGFPHVWSEGAWSFPNRYRTEMPMTMAAYAAMQGIDALCPFVLEPSGRLAESVWSVQTPAILGQFPAAALLFRRGDVAQAPVVVDEQLRLDDLMDLKGAATETPQGLDTIRASELPPGQTITVMPEQGLDPLVFLAGRVVRTISRSGSSLTLDQRLVKAIERSKGRVKSVLPGLSLDYRQGVLTVDTPRTVAVIGQPAGEVRLQGFRLNLKNDYGALVVTSLDGVPLRRSKRMLVQVMTEQQNAGWQTEPFRDATGRYRRLVREGGSPLLVRQPHGTVRFPVEVQVEAVGTFDAEKSDAKWTTTELELRRATSHYVISRETFRDASLSP